MIPSMKSNVASAVEGGSHELSKDKGKDPHLRSADSK